MSSYLESDLVDAVEWGSRLLVSFNAEKLNWSLLIAQLILVLMT